MLLVFALQLNFDKLTQEVKAIKDKLPGLRSMKEGLLQEAASLKQEKKMLADGLAQVKRLRVGA